MASYRTDSRPTAMTLAAFLAVAVIGGGNAVAIKIGLSEMAPFWSAAVRFLISSVLLFGLMAVIGLPMPRGRALGGASVFGALNFGMAFALVYFALTEVSAGTTQVAIALTPVVVVLLAALQGIETLRGRAVAGALLAFAGATVIFADGMHGAPLGKFLALLAAVFCFAEAAIVVKRFPRVNPIAENAVGQGVGGAILLFFSYLSGEIWNVPSDISTIASLLFLIFLGSMALFGLYVFVIEKWTVSAASYALVAMPVFTIFFAALLLDESITLQFFFGTAAIALGFYFGVLSRANRDTRMDTT
jgi:drug/metabolite transporter (DMT)-like permease